MSDLERKTAEVIALKFRTAPWTLQRFLESIKRGEEILRDQCQEIVTKDDARPEAIGVVDESGVVTPHFSQTICCATEEIVRSLDEDTRTAS